jgi:menaquinone-specific isochorismate synthase
VTATTPLVAHTTPLSGDVDLVAVAGDGGLLWEHDGEGIAARGEACRIELPGGLAREARERRVAGRLAEIESNAPDVAGTGPVALASLPFDRDRPATVVVPQLAVRRLADGRAWLTTIGPADAEAEADAHAGTSPPLNAVELDAEERRPPDAFTLTPTVGHGEFCEQVAAATKEIARGALEKVVLAREVVVTANRPILTADVVARLRALYPSCMVFSINGFVGASPELLVSRRGNRVRSHPLAGTFARSGDPRSDEALAARLVASTKDRWEHRLVVDAVAEGLARCCDELTVPDDPEILLLRNVIHLGTEIAGRLRGIDPPSALDLVAALHPTPAVGGTPRRAALAHLRTAEAFDRDRYAGAVGWVDRRGDGDWAIAIRSAELDGPRARLFAGVGIVDGSEPEAELVETQLKLQALLAAVVRP